MTEKVVVGLLCDPDLPSVIADRLAAALPDDLSRGDGTVWEVEAVCDPFEALAPDAEQRLLDKARDRVRHTGWDLALCLTDAPLRDEESVIVAEVSVEDRVALVSLPALGGFMITRRARRLVVPLIRYLAGRTDRVPAFGGRNRVRAAAPSWANASSEIVVDSALGIPRLVAGMVRANRPWQFVLGLSRALAGALTGSAFGVLYSNIWQLAASLSPWRLATMAGGAIGILVTWLITDHDLWERRRSPSTGLRNAGTVLTVGFGVAVFFVELFAFVLVAVGVVASPGYLSRIIGHPAGITDYLTVALMATVMGTVAGAVGSGLENDTTVRRATYGHREWERWRTVRDRDR
ncbi:hypothetical protein [Pseudonocardia spinosispora]|uniref:hypothetical protein n=1 Tax=Pseudonocardia spinosispora TaxID=103441 RepID=UPI00040ADD4B|nr:hypothetical protein [Pseudonocardia spinosispora]